MDDLTEFLRLSSALNYNLSAASLNRYNVMMFIVGGKPLHPDERLDREYKSLLMEGIGYLFSAYRQKRRRLGPMAVLHPLRATALYARARERLFIVDILSALFHDVLEDILPVDFSDRDWEVLEGQLYDLLGRLDSDEEWALMERLQALTRFDSETYYQYIGRLLERAVAIPELIQVKLADRLDNTLDMRIDIQDPLEGVDFYKTIFQLLFVNNFPMVRPSRIRPPSVVINGARRLYQLFKNAVLLTMIRQRVDIADDPVAVSFFNATCTASLKEAQRTLLNTASDRQTALDDVRPIVLEAMAYCQSGRIDQITRLVPGESLDGLFSNYFSSPSFAIRESQLDDLYRNKPLMIEASVAFIVIFLSYMNDPSFYIRGISADGVMPE